MNIKENQRAQGVAVGSDCDEQDGIAQQSVPVCRRAIGAHGTTEVGNTHAGSGKVCVAAMNLVGHPSEPAVPCANVTSAWRVC